MDDEGQRILDAVTAAGKPASAAALRKTLALPERAVKQALDALVAEGQLFRVLIAGRAAYSMRDLDVGLEADLCAALADGPLSRSAIDKRVRGVPPALRKRAFDRLLARGDVFRHPPIGRFRERFGLAPPDPVLYIARAVAELRKQERSLRACGVGEQAWRAALAQTLGVEAPPHSDDDASLLAAVADLTAQEGDGSLLSIRRLRAMRALDKPRFDAAMLRLAEAGKVTLHYHDFPQSLSPEERDALVADPRGVFYVGVALRR